MKQPAASAWTAGSLSLCPVHPCSPTSPGSHRTAALLLLSASSSQTTTFLNPAIALYFMLPFNNIWLVDHSFLEYLSGWLWNILLNFFLPDQLPSLPFAQTSSLRCAQSLRTENMCSCDCVYTTDASQMPMPSPTNLSEWLTFFKSALPSASKDAEQPDLSYNAEGKAKGHSEQLVSCSQSKTCADYGPKSHF